MKDWKALAQAANLDIPPADVDRIFIPLGALDAAFRPLLKSLTPDIEPATVNIPEEHE